MHGWRPKIPLCPRTLLLLSTSPLTLLPPIPLHQGIRMDRETNSSRFPVYAQHLLENYHEWLERIKADRLQHRDVDKAAARRLMGLREGGKVREASFDAGQLNLYDFGDDDDDEEERERERQEERRRAGRRPGARDGEEEEREGQQQQREEEGEEGDGRQSPPVIGDGEGDSTSSTVAEGGEDEQDLMEEEEDEGEW